LEATIAAIATPPGTGGIAIIRISGENALSVTRAVFPIDADNPRKLTLGNVTAGGRTIDKALGVYFRCPDSYTGEDVCELHLHGGRVIARTVLSALTDAGARMAEPGEFTRRAFMNGKIDLSGAEAVQQSIMALSERGANVSANQLSGGVAEKVQALRDGIMKVTAALMAGIEYPEEDLGIADTERVHVLALADEARQLKETYHSGRILREGLRVALLGAPNAGKSSLLNAILGEDRAIVTAIPGTTRDVLEEYCEFDGVPIVFMDTAGIRESEDVVESIGIERSRKAAEKADVLLVLIDGAAADDATGREVSEYAKSLGKPVIEITTKADIAEGDVSAKTGEGIEELLSRLTKAAELSLEGVMISSERQRNALLRAEQALTNAADTLSMGELDCASIDLEEALYALGEITGESVTEDIIDRIFSDFCLGK